MRSFLERLFAAGRESPSDESVGDTATVRRIVGELESLPPERARFVAAFAFLLGRVANADLEISADETAAMERLIREVGELPEDQAVLATQIAKSQNRLFGGTESFQVARELRSISSADQRRHVLECLFAVSAADDEVDADEERQIRQVADELGLSHRDFVEARSTVHDQRTVIRRLRRKRSLED